MPDCEKSNENKKSAQQFRINYDKVMEAVNKLHFTLKDFFKDMN